MSTPISSPVPVRRWRRVLVVSLIVVLLLFGPILFAWGYFEWRVAYRMAKIRAKGEPTTWKEAKTFITDKAPTPNCAILWQRAWETQATVVTQQDRQQLPFVGKSHPVPLGETWPDIEAAEIYLKDHKETLSLIEQASDFGGQAYFDLDWSLGFMALLHHISELQVLFDLEALATHVAIHRDDGDKAAMHLKHRLALVHAIADDASIVAALTQRSWLLKSLPQVGQLCSLSSLNEQSLKTVMARLESLSFVAIEDTLIKERAVVASLPETAIYSNSDLFARLVSRRAFVSDYLDEMTDAIDVVKSTKGDWKERIAQAGSWDRRHSHASPGLSAERIFSSLYLPSVGRIAESMAIAEATVSLACTAIAVRRYYDRHGAPPDALDALASDLLAEPLLDPFDNQPLGYIVSKNKVLIYSKGPNGVAEEGRGEEEGGDDLAIEIVLPGRK